MAYLIDRTRALRVEELVAALPVRQRRIRSRVILRDNSLYHTLTRTKTLTRTVNDQRQRYKGAQWWQQP